MRKAKQRDCLQLDPIDLTWSHLIIADVRVERSDEHEALVEQLVDAFLVGLNALHTVCGEGQRTVCDESHGAQHIRHDHRLEHVELKMSVAASNRHCDMVPHHLCRHHGYGLTLCRVHLAFRTILHEIGLTVLMTRTLWHI